MSFKAIFYAYVLGGITFIPLVVVGILFYTIYTSVPVGDPDPAKFTRAKLERESQEEEKVDEGPRIELTSDSTLELNDLPKPRKGWLTVRRTFEEAPTDGSYVGFVRGFLDARSKDPKRSRPKDMWYVALKGKILYLYEDEAMLECEAAIELGGHDVVVYPENLMDGELFAKRNAICLKPKVPSLDKAMPSVTKEMKFGENEELTVDESSSEKQKERERVRLAELEKKREEARAQALEVSTPWFIFVRSCVEMEDWYHALVHASDHPANAPTLPPLSPVFRPIDMNHLVTTLDEQPDVIPMRWLNALIGRVFFSFYRTQTLESYIIGRLMKKLSKVKRPGFLTHIVVKEVSVGDTAPVLSKPMLKELTKEGDASMEVHIQYKGEIRITVEAVATINLGARFKSYTVKLVLAAVLRELEGNLLVKVKRPPSNRLWYAFTTMPRMVLDVEPVVSDRQITWGMILSTIESRLKEVIQESVVLPNMDDIAFFDSSSSSHRGGIYADTSRHENPPSSFPESPPPPDDDRTPASEPIPETTPIPPVTSNSPEPKPPLQRSHSAEEAESSKSSEPTPSLTRPATVSATGYSPNNNSSSSSSSSATKRKSWFAAVKEGGSDDPFGDVYDDGYSRGRPSGVDPMRRSSSPHSLNGVNTPDAEDQSNKQHLNPVPVRAALSNRSLSSSSQGASEPSSSSVDDSSTSAPSESLLAAFRSRSPSISLPKKDNGVSTGSNFFQTLKSRDKQAISNTAKEAMRKWGVNWGGLKKDSMPTVNPSDQDTSPDPRRALASEQPNNKHRPSYAEVRAAVEQRRERERVEADGLGLSDSQTTLRAGHSRSGSTSSNVPLVDEQRSASPAYLGGATLSPSTSPRPPAEDERLDVPSRPPSPRARTLSHRSTGPSEGGNLPDEVEHPSDVPLHTRPPQPKMMTIPGIHASHRGEVMSMGYAPPPVVPSEPKKAPAIQSISRLWNKSTTPGQPQTQIGFTGNDQDANSTPLASSSSPPRPEIPTTSSTTTSPGSPPPLPSRPIPPPLPPRSNTTHAVQTKPDSPRAGDTDQGTSPASAALQSIVSKDRSKRESLGNLTSNSTPPSPGRREDPAGDDTVSDRPVSVNLDGGDSAVPCIPDSSFTPTDMEVSPKPPSLPPRRIQASA